MSDVNAVNTRPSCVLGIHVAATALLPDFDAPSSVMPETVDDLTMAVEPRLSDDETVLAIYPAWKAEPTTRWVETTRLALGSTRVLAYQTSLPPTGAGVLATLAARLTREVDSPGHLLALLPVLERSVRVMALLTSVSKLEQPSPSLWQHASSLLGLSSFIVVFNGRHSRVQAHKKAEDLDLATPKTPTGVHVASAGGDPMWMYKAVESWWPGARLQLEPEAEDPYTFWGGTQWIEAVAYPTDISYMLKLSRRAPPLLRCRWCRAMSPPVERTCQFCGVALSPSSLSGAET